MLWTILINLITMLIALIGLIYQPKEGPQLSTTSGKIKSYGKVLFFLIIILSVLNIIKSLDDEKKHAIEVKMQIQSISELSTSHEELKEVNTHLINELNERFKNLDNFVSKMKSVEEDKVLASTSNKLSEVIKLAFDLQKRDIPFKWGGKSPDEGFDSSGFVAYLLNRVNIIQRPETYWSGLLRSEFGSKKFNSESELQIGDILFYEQGICMLYLGGSRCIGMLPGGIITTELEFGVKRIGYGRVNYS